MTFKIGDVVDFRCDGLEGYGTVVLGPEYCGVWGLKVTEARRYFGSRPIEETLHRLHGQVDCGGRGWWVGTDEMKLRLPDLTMEEML